MFNKDKILVLGTGYIGSAYKEAGWPAISYEEFYNLRNDWIDFYNKFSNYDVILNALAWTDTKSSELIENKNKVFDANSSLVRDLSKMCFKYGKKFIHLSTSDLYGNEFNYHKNIETEKHLDVATTYRLSKLMGEIYCNPDDLILRIRLPFDDRNHPKNLIKKIIPFNKFYHWINSYSYVPDIIKATEILLENNEKGLFNIGQFESMSILYLMRNVLKLEHLQHIDMHDKTHPNLITALDNIHIHNDINTEKLRKYFIQTPLDSCWTSSYFKLKDQLDKLPA